MSTDLNRGPISSSEALKVSDLVPVDLSKKLIEKREELRKEISAELAKHMDYDNL